MHSTLGSDSAISKRPFFCRIKNSISQMAHSIGFRLAGVLQVKFYTSTVALHHSQHGSSHKLLHAYAFQLTCIVLYIKFWYLLSCLSEPIENLSPFAMVR